MNTTVNAVRYIIFLEETEESPIKYYYRVVDAIVPGLRSQGTCDLGMAKCFSMVFPDAVTNFKILDDKIVLGWSEDSFAVFENLLKNLQSVYKIVGIDENAMHRVYENMTEEDDDDEPWDIDISDDERITNPSIRELGLEKYNSGSKVDMDAFDNWELPGDTPGIGQPGFHWGM